MTILADPSTFTITRHAALRILDMAIEPAEIRRALTRGRFHSHGTDPSLQYLTIGRVSLVVDSPDDHGCRRVITVLWSTEHDWRTDQSRGAYRGRDGIRDNSNLRRKRR